MIRKFAIGLLFLCALAVCIAQSVDSAVYVKQFPGGDVGSKVTNAMATCNAGSVVPCLLVIDPSLAAWAPGTLPAMCATCYLLDYRSGPPAQSLPIAQFNPRGAYSSVATYHTADTVTNGGSLWECITGCSGVTPVAGANWMLLPTTPGPTSAQFSTLTSKIPLGDNKFNTAAATQNYYLVGTTGALSSSASYFTSDYIAVVPGTTLVSNVAIGAPAAGYAFYDISETYLSGANGTVSAGTTITVPSTAAFFRFAALMSVQSTAMLMVGTTTPADFAPYDPTLAASTAQATATTNAIAAINSSLPGPRNLFSSAAATTGYYLTSSCAATSNAGFEYSDYIPVLPSTAYVLAVALGGSSGAGGSCYYDASKVKISAGPTLGSAAGTTFTTPSNAAFFRFSQQTSDAATQMLTAGTTPPAAYVQFSQANEANAAATNGVLIAYQGDSICQVYRNTWGPTIISRLGVTESLIDCRGGRTTQQALEYYGNYAPYPALNGTISSVSLTSNVLTVNGSFPSAYPLGTSVKFNGLTSTFGTVLLSLVCSVQSGATTSSFTATCTYGGATWTYANQGSTPDSGNVIPTLASGTVTSVAYVSSSNTVTIGGAFPAYPSGTVVGFSGLTAGSFLVSVPSSTSPVTISCTVNGGATTSLFSAVCVSATGQSYPVSQVALSHANVSTTSDAGTVVSPGYNVGCLWADNMHNICGSNGIVGNTFAQDIAHWNPAIYASELGTNDGGRTVGSSTDLAGAASEYGDIKAVIESIFLAKPGVHQVWLAPYLQRTSSVVTVILNAAAQYGVPVENTMIDSPMDNPFSWTTNLLIADHTHPTTAGGLILGGVWAEFIKMKF